jgi:hypothetical protein
MKVMTKERIFGFLLFVMLAIFVAALMFSPVMSFTPAGRRVISFIEHNKILGLKVGEIESIKIDKFMWNGSLEGGYYVNEYSVHVRGSLGEERVALSERCREDGSGCDELSIR